MKLKLFGLIILSTFIVLIASAQKKVNIVFNENKVLTINKLTIDTETNIKKLFKKIGKPSKTADHPKGDLSYFYDNTGLVFNVVEGEIRGVGINYNWDGDERFPETSFTGNFMIVDYNVTKESSSKDLAGIEGLAIQCPFPMMCGMEPAESGLLFTAAFEENKITQVWMLFDK